MLTLHPGIQCGDFDAIRSLRRNAMVSVWHSDQVKRVVSNQESNRVGAVISNCICFGDFDATHNLRQNTMILGMVMVH